MMHGPSYHHGAPVRGFPAIPIEMVFPGAPNLMTTPPINSYSRYFAQQRHH